MVGGLQHGRSVDCRPIDKPACQILREPIEIDGNPVDGMEYDPIAWHFFLIVEEGKDFVSD